MVLRESCLPKIRPFIGKDIMKVLAGIRRGGMPFLSSISRFFKAEKRTAAPETTLNYLKVCEEAAIQREFGPLPEVRGNYLKMVL